MTTTQKRKTSSKLYIENAKITLFNLLFYSGSSIVKSIPLEAMTKDMQKHTLTTFIENTLSGLNGQLRKDSLLKTLESKPVVYVNIRRISPNGLNRDMSFYAFNKYNDNLQDITYMVSTLLDGKEPKIDKYNRHVIRVSGTGMDMAFHCVYNLSGSLFHESFKLLQSYNYDIPETGYLLKHKTI